MCGTNNSPLPSPINTQYQYCSVTVLASAMGPGKRKHGLHTHIHRRGTNTLYHNYYIMYTRLFIQLSTRNVPVPDSHLGKVVVPVHSVEWERN